MLKIIKQAVWQLQQRNQKASALAFLRVALCSWYLKELLFRWPALELLYSNNSILKIKASNSFQLFHLDIAFFYEHYLVLVYCCIVLLFLNLFGIGKNILAFILFIALTILYNLNDKFGNSGDEMVLLLFFYLSFANSFSRFTLFKQKQISVDKQHFYNLMSNLAAYSIIFNLCLAYFLAGTFKAQDPYWIKGIGIHYFLNDERFSIFAAGNTLHLPTWLMYLVNYGTIAFELSFPFLVWFRQSRNVVLSLGLMMHLGIYLFLMIYGMSIVFIIQYVLFFTEEELNQFFQKIKLLFIKRKQLQT